jgi:hypothetical protein
MTNAIRSVLNLLWGISDAPKRAPRVIVERR